MKSLFAFASIVALSAAPALAADGQISSRSLAAMGLHGMATMSDADGMHVRGASATVGGFSLSSVPGAAASSAYYGSGPNSASGYTVSVAANSVGYYGTFVLAAGASRAH